MAQRQATGERGQGIAAIGIGGRGEIAGKQPQLLQPAGREAQPVEQRAEADHGAASRCTSRPLTSATSLVRAAPWTLAFAGVTTKKRGARLPAGRHNQSVIAAKAGVHPGNGTAPDGDVAS